MGSEWIVSQGEVEELKFDIERDLLCVVDDGGHFTSLNGGWKRVLGWTSDELMSRPYIDFVHPDDRERTLEEAAKGTRPGREIAKFENRYRVRSGGWRWLRWSARSDGKSWFAVAYDVTEEKEAERRLQRILTDEHLVAYSQPIMDQRRGSVAQEELLARLRAPDSGDGVIAPSEFLPDVERSGLIGLVDRWMVSQGAAVASQGRRAEVNLSARSIEDEALAIELTDAIARTGACAENLIFEITETAALTHLDAAQDFAERLTGLGCSFALDDFGTGFGSLTYLRQLPVRYLKIDASFVRHLVASPEDRAIVRGIVAIARELGMLTVAEGIEDTETLALVRDYGVDYAQGYLIGPPTPLG
jgi:PAS domain S-box-containing protein